MLGVRSKPPRHPSQYSLTVNLPQFWLDRNKISFKTRVRGAFWFIVVIQGAWWSWGTALVTRFRVVRPMYDWETPGFGPAFALYVCLNFGFQLNFLFLYELSSPVTGARHS